MIVRKSLRIQKRVYIWYSFKKEYNIPQNLYVAKYKLILVPVIIKVNTFAFNGAQDKLFVCIYHSNV